MDFGIPDEHRALRTAVADVAAGFGNDYYTRKAEAREFTDRVNIAEAVVVGLPHERWAEAITAIVVPAPGTHLDERELLSRVRAHLDPYKVPKAVITVDTPGTMTSRPGPELRFTRPVPPEPAGTRRCRCGSGRR